MRPAMCGCVGVCDGMQPMGENSAQFEYYHMDINCSPWHRWKGHFLIYDFTLHEKWSLHSPRFIINVAILHCQPNFQFRFFPFFFQQFFGCNFFLIFVFCLSVFRFHKAIFELSNQVRWILVQIANRTKAFLGKFLHILHAMQRINWSVCRSHATKSRLKYLSPSNSIIIRPEIPTVHISIVDCSHLKCTHNKIEGNKKNMNGTISPVCLVSLKHAADWGD